MYLVKKIGIVGKSPTSSLKILCFAQKTHIIVKKKIENKCMPIFYENLRFLGRTQNLQARFSTIQMFFCAPFLCKNGNFCHVRLPCKSRNLIILGYPSNKSQYHRNPTPFLNFLDNFSFKMMFLNSNKTFQSLGLEYSLRTNLEVFRHFLFYRFDKKRW
jgi:hypothetical protein